MFQSKLHEFASVRDSDGVALGFGCSPADDCWGKEAAGGAPRATPLVLSGVLSKAGPELALPSVEASWPSSIADRTLPALGSTAGASDSCGVRADGNSAPATNCPIGLGVERPHEVQVSARIVPIITRAAGATPLIIAAFSH